ncbi:phage protein [Streptococcus pneumoniae]|nr:phage protein [Streptococcus pneumoniae]
MNTEQLNQALQMTIREMSTTSTDSMIASNFLSIQLNEQREENQRLRECFALHERKWRVHSLQECKR